MSNWSSALSVELDDEATQVITNPGSSDRGAATLWAVILAGGEGIRLQSLTQYVAGDMRPNSSPGCSAGAPCSARRSIARG